MDAAQPRHELIYAEPRYYDIGFSQRDIQGETGFLEYLSRNLGRGRLEAFLEICCGPGHHMCALAARGIRSHGIETSRPMVTYVEEQVFASVASANDEATTDVRSAECTIALGDPRDFSIPEAVDLAFCPRNEFHYLLRREDIVAHLVAVAKNLGRGGLYVMELEHPAVLCGQRAGWPQRWTSAREGTSVEVRIGTGEEQIDPLQQIVDLEIALEVSENGESMRIVDSAPIRLCSYQELHALVRLSGAFDWIATFGDLSITQPFDRSDASRAMVPVLRCNM